MIVGTIEIYQLAPIHKKKISMNVVIEQRVVFLVYWIRVVDTASWEELDMKSFLEGKRAGKVKA